MLALSILMAIAATICCVESMPAYFYRCYREAENEPIYERVSSASSSSSAYVPSSISSNGWHPVYPVQTRHTSRGCQCATQRTPSASRPAAVESATSKTAPTTENSAKSTEPQELAPKPPKVAEVVPVSVPVASSVAEPEQPSMSQVLREILTYMKDISGRMLRVEKASAVNVGASNATVTAVAEKQAAAVAKSGAK